MEIFGDETEFTDIRMVRVVDMFERRPRMQRIIRCGFLGIEYEDLDVTGDDDDDDDDDDSWLICHNNFHGYPRLSERSDRELSGKRTTPSSLLCRSPRCTYNGCEHHHLSPSIPVQEQESDTERKARLLQEMKKSKQKTEKKRLKKQKQKERRRQDRLEKEKQNPAKNVEGTDDPQLSKADKSKAVKDESKHSINTSIKEAAPAKDTGSSDSSEDESTEKVNDSGDSEELDLTSTFVSKAALIARRKLEQKSRSKKKVAVKEETKTVPVKPNENKENKDVVAKEVPAEPSSPTFEDNLKMSADLAVIGNQCASVGNYNLAVKYFTDAIMYNPKEFKLFGNRSFCFEKMQEYGKALTDAELSLSMYPGWVKGLFRKGRALAGLKRYEEACLAFREVLKMDSACTEAAQELMRVQITQLMEYGYTREQSSNALIIHGTVNKALEVLSKLNQAGAVQNGSLPLVQVANVTGTSPVLSAITNAAPPQSTEAPKIPLMNKPLGPVHNTSNVPNEPKPIPQQAMKTNSGDKPSPPELFPVWVGNLFQPVSESLITNLFGKVGAIFSVKLLTNKRCAFVNYTKQEYCDEAIRRFNGFELMGTKIAVRYPDRIPHGMGISKSAIKAEDLQDENMRQREYAGEYWRNAGESHRPVRPYRPFPNYRGPHKN